jgi:hypothetical protein
MITGEDKAKIAAITTPMKIEPILKDTFAFLMAIVGPYF